MNSRFSVVRFLACLRMTGTVSFVLALIVLSIASSTVLAQQEGGVLRPEVGTAVKFDISPPLRDIPINLSTKAKKAEDDKGAGGPVGDFTHSPDPVLQSTVGTGIFSQPQVEIPGLSVNFIGRTGTAQPPDPNGDIGPNHYVQMVNSTFQIFNRAGNSVFGPSNINTLFSGFGGPCQTENAGDPVVLYDQLADRWLLSQFSDSVGPFFNCVAISQTPNPLGPYYRYAFTAPSFPDYPKYGVWPDGYYLNTREGGLLGLYALERAEMLVGNPGARFIKFTVSESGANPTNGFLNADLDGYTLPPPGAPNYLIGSRDNNAGATSDALVLFKFHADWAVPANSTFTGPTVFPTASIDTIFPCTPTSRSCIPQPPAAGGVRLDILSYRQRPTFRLTYRNFGTHESLVTTQSVEASAGIAGMRWWEVRNPSSITPTLHQEGTYGPGATDGIHRWMGSIAMDRQGNMALGYSVSDAVSVFPGIRYTGRLVTDPLGEMPQGEGTIVDGGGSQLTSSNRWGDYSSMNIDPLDDCTFWYTQEYYVAPSTSSYATRIASFRFPGCRESIPRSRADFDGDGRSDLSVFRPSEGNWYLNQSAAGLRIQNWGLNGDIPVPGDFDNDGKTDIAIYRGDVNELNPDFFVLQSSNSTFTSASWGLPGDTPMTGDFDGDQKTDFVVYRSSNNTWYIFTSTGGFRADNFGSSGDVPLVMDYEGDGVSNIAVFRPSNQIWYIAKPTGVPAQNFYAIPFGSATDAPVPADYDGDGHEDIAVFRPGTGVWYVLRSTNGVVETTVFGLNGDVPVPGDYDGDGRDDIALYRDGAWYLNRSTNGLVQFNFGLGTDIPIAKKYIP